MLNKNSSSSFYVWVGTIAELIKLAPVIIELRIRGSEVIPIATGQNDLTKSDLYPIVFPNGIDYWITNRSIKQTPFYFSMWTLECLARAIFQLSAIFRVKRKNFFDFSDQVKSSQRANIIVHGDTVSTFIGGFVGWVLRANVIHVEAGLRSFNLLRPFPEEICRVLVSYFASVAFCPGDWSCNNLSRLNRKRLKVVNTFENTLLDSMRMALTTNSNVDIFNKIPPRFFLFVCHRQENLLDKNFLTNILDRVTSKSAEIPCVAIIHKPAEVALKSIGLLDQLIDNRNIVCLQRQSYFDFTKLIKIADFVVTDGGSNQEECYFMGKACLILRKESERTEGLGKNALLSMKDFNIIDDFFKNPLRWARAPISSDVMPSVKVVEVLLD